MNDSQILESTGQTLRLRLRPDWTNRLLHHLNSDPLNPREFAQKLLNYQADHNLFQSGWIDAPTRLTLIRDFPELAIQMIGPQTTAGEVIMDTAQTEESRFTKASEILNKMHHSLVYTEDYAQILSIRGVSCSQGTWVRTQSAARFLEAPYGSRQHFSSNKPDYRDSLFLLMWIEDGTPHIREFSGTVNPNCIWPKGTAHLCPGQYFYRIGRHRTRDSDHIEAALKSRDNGWPQDWIYDITPDSVQYIALESASPIEVVRSNGESLDISPEDITAAEIAIAERKSDFTDENRIKINIHTCACYHASSLGCQNICPEEYADFMHILVRLSQKQIDRYGMPLDVPYSLIDASYI